jgi:uncharacterized protein involved in exopolysaccharide biosynthesis
MSAKEHAMADTMPPMPEFFDGGASNDPPVFRFDPRRIIWGLWQRRGTIIGITAAATCLALIVGLGLIDRTWTGKATLFKKEQQDEFRVGRYGLPFKRQEYAIKTLLDTLLLPGTLETAMRRTGVNIPGYQMASLVDIHMSRDSKAFTIAVTWDDPEIAAALTNSLVDSFIERNTDLRRHEIEKNLFRYRERYEEATLASDKLGDELLAFEASNDIADTRTQLIVLLEKRQEVEVNLRTTEGEVIAARQRIIDIGSQIDEQPEMIVQSSYYVNPLQKNLGQLEWELAQARGKYTDENPKVQDLLLRIEKLKALIEDGKDDVSPSNTYAHNPVREELTVNRYEAQAEAARMGTQVERLRTVLSELDQRVTQLTSTRKAHEDLQSRRQGALQLSSDLKERVDSLSVLLEAENGDFELIERARVPSTSNPTGRAVIMLAIFVFGGLLAIAIACAAELVNGSVKTRRDLEMMTDAPILLETGDEIDDREGVTSLGFRRMLTDLQAACEDETPVSIGVSPIDADGFSFQVFSRIAASLRAKGEQHIAIDVDMRIDLNRAYDENSPLAGATTRSLLNGTCDCDEVANGELVSAGDGDDNALMQLGSQRMKSLKKNLESRSSYVIYNLPPVSDHEVAFEALNCLGRVILVVHSGQTRKRDLRETIERLNLHGIEVMAAVIVGVPSALLTHANVLGEIVTEFSFLLRDAWKRIRARPQPE